MKLLELVDLRRHPIGYMHPFFDRIASAGGSSCSLQSVALFFWVLL